MTPALLRAAGELLYGERWQAELAREIGRARSLVFAMASGERAITADTWARVVAALETRRVDIAAFVSANAARQPKSK